MFIPAKQKYRKVHRNRNGLKGKATRGNKVSFGEHGLKSLEKGELSSRQIEAARRTMARYIKRGGKIWIRVFPHKPITQKAAEVPMGAGKGNVEYYVATIKPGTVIFEIGGLTAETSRNALLRASHKLPVKCRLVTSSLF